MRRTTLLFQGDSITDAHRDFEDVTSLGMGYAYLIASELCFQQPGAYHVLNKGISGNRIVDVYARWKRDALKLTPDVLTLLIGINDIWHEKVREEGVLPDRFEALYTMLLEDTRKALPSTRIILMEPFALGDVQDAFKNDLPGYQACVKRLSEQFATDYVPLQQRFEQAAEAANWKAYLHDGVHPTPAGHRLIATAWHECFAHR